MYRLGVYMCVCVKITRTIRISYLNVNYEFAGNENNSVHDGTRTRER